MQFDWLRWLDRLIRMNPGIYRRNFLQFLVASPLLSADEKAEMKDILNVMDFEAKAKAAIPPAHFGYLSTGVDDDKTLRANMEGYNRIFLRPRRMVDISKIDTSIQLYGEKWATPIILAPTGHHKAFYPEAAAIPFVIRLWPSPDRGAFEKTDSDWPLARASI